MNQDQRHANILNLSRGVFEDALQLTDWAASLSPDVDGGIFPETSKEETARILYGWAYLAHQGTMPPADEAVLERIEWFLVVNGCPVLTKELILFGLKEEDCHD